MLGLLFVGYAAIVVRQEGVVCSLNNMKQLIKINVIKSFDKLPWIVRKFKKMDMKKCVELSVFYFFNITYVYTIPRTR